MSKFGSPPHSLSPSTFTAALSIKESRRDEGCKDEQAVRVGNNAQQECQQGREQQSYQRCKNKIHDPATGSSLTGY